MSALLLCPMDIDAVRARQDIFKYTQPDSTEVSVRLNGDESFHYYVSADGIPLLESSDGGLYFATMHGSEIVNSGIKACDADKRTTSMMQGITPVSEAQLAAYLRNESMKSPKFKATDPHVGIGKFDTTFPTSGNAKALVILVEYSDVAFQLKDPKRYFTDLLNKDGFSEYGATGSAREYFLASSNGQFDLTCDVYGPVKLPRNRAYYGSNNAYGSDSNPEDMVVHSVELLDSSVDFSEYDCDKDGILDNVFIFYAGAGEASGGPGSSVWPHSWELRQAGKAFTVDGVLVDHYACTNEIQGDLPDGIGTFCHEFSHIMGLPDLYDTAGYSSAKTPGAWSVMDYGPYNNNSRTPPVYSAYERNAMGWLDLVTVDEACDMTLTDIKESNSAMLVATKRKNEFYLFENRQQTGWDTYLPGHGMLIWRIDFDADIWRRNQVNTDGEHQYVDLIEACGDYGADAEAAWPGPKGVSSFSGMTTPAFVDWNGKVIDLPLTDIAETDGRITFKVDGGDFELATPGRIEVTGHTPISLTVKWQGVERAKEYHISAYRTGGLVQEYVNGFRDRKYDASELEAEIFGLEPETEYAIELTAVAGSRRSTVVNLVATTDKMSFPYITPEVLPAGSITADGFTANWRPVEGAADYRITVEGVVDHGDQTETCDFGGVIFRVPKGWEYSLKTSKYTDPAWCGAAVPSAKVNMDGAYLESPEFKNDVSSVSFWYRMSSGGEGSQIIVNGLKGDTWTIVSEIDLRSSKGETVEITDIPEGVSRIRLVFLQEKNAYIALDDVSVTGGGVTRTTIEHLSDVSTGNVTSLGVQGLPAAQTGFYYKVRAVSVDGELSRYSDEQYVNSDVSAVAATKVSGMTRFIQTSDRSVLYCGDANASIRVYDVAGRLVAVTESDAAGNAALSFPDSLSTGLYIINDGCSSYRILID